ncbi:MAG: YbjN domain-containing protein [Rhodobacteraceae bacterium]|nr:YbjN domain-containing protein [Paracoccaceae bacterium]
MRSAFMLSVLAGFLSTSAAMAQQTGDAISDGLAALLGRAQQGSGPAPVPGGGGGGLALGGDLIDATSPQAIADVLQDAGYRAAVGTDNIGDPKIDSSAAGADFTIYFYGCENGTNCQSLQFSSGYDLERGTSFQTMNDWNATQRFGYAYLDNESDPYVNMDINMSYGLTADNLRDSLAIWEQVLADFHTHIDW